LTETHCTILSGASFPVEHVDVVVPKVAEIVFCRLSREDASFVVSLDVSLLERLSQALGSEKVTLCFKDASSPITVYPNETPKDAFGLLMPIRTA
jgi:DNA polymerase III sliding clamp (beta) subunit (PCNA family)